MQFMDNEQEVIEPESELLALIGKTIEQVSGRNIVPSDEIVDALLDIGNLAMKEDEQSLHYFAVALRLCRDLCYYSDQYGVQTPPKGWAPKGGMAAMFAALQDAQRREREASE